MKLQPIVRVKLAKFREDYELQNVSDGVAFERFANQVILSTHQPGAFSVDDSLGCRLRRWAKRYGARRNLH